MKLRLVSLWKKGSGGPKFLDSFRLSKNIFLLLSDFWWSRRYGHSTPHSSCINKSATLRVKLICYESVPTLVCIPLQQIMNKINMKNFSSASHCICVTFLHWWLPIVMNWKYLDGPLESTAKFINGRTLECSIRYF